MLGIDITQILLHILNIVILFAGLYVILYSPVVKFMKKREDYYKEMDENANQKMADAETMKAQYQEKLDAVDSEIIDMKKSASAEITNMKDKAEQDAKLKANKIIEDARREAEEQKKNIVVGAKDSIVKMVEEAANKIVISGDVSQAYDMFLDDAERSKKNG
ncbi:MAG: ATP synthase F0 subunit B [Eubacterium sp.]|nr:ATP synthase F0 subunit B [Eubacterium sp.]